MYAVEIDSHRGGRVYAMPQHGITTTDVQFAYKRTTQSSMENFIKTLHGLNPKVIAVVKVNGKWQVAPKRIVVERCADGWLGKGSFKSQTVLCVVNQNGNWSRFALGGWTAEGEGRLEFGGSMVKGPHLYASGLASVIDTHGGTARERERNQKMGVEHDVTGGETVVCDGVEYELVVKVQGYDRYINFKKI